MNGEADPFLHHPKLRGRIADPLKSNTRSFSAATLEAHMKETGSTLVWWHSDQEREASRAQTLAGRLDTDLWVFGYGSLMWDPAFRFVEVRRAHVPEYERQFILKDIYGGRGTAEAPGLMAALDAGTGCDGLLFKIAAEDVDAETEILWRREKVGPAYHPVFVDAVISDRRIEALAFVADHEAELIDANLTRDEKVHYLATGTGFLGTSFEYLDNIATQFDVLGIEDEAVTALLHETKNYMNSR